MTRPNADCSDSGFAMIDIIRTVSLGEPQVHRVST